NPPLEGRLCLAKARFGAADPQHGVVGHLAPDVAERAAWHGTRDAANRLLAEDDLVARLGLFDLETPQSPVRVPAEVETRDRLLARVAALGEGDVRRVEPGLGRKDGLVELLAPHRGAGLDPERLELLRVRGLELLLAPRLPRVDAVVVVADSVA